MERRAGETAARIDGDPEKKSGPTFCACGGFSGPSFYPS